MIDFYEELEKYKPALEIEQIESSMSGNEIQDLMDVLKQMMKQIKLTGKE